MTDQDKTQDREEFINRLKALNAMGLELTEEQIFALTVHFTGVTGEEIGKSLKSVIDRLDKKES
ncbi:hypothetical protein [Paenibacillus medicaginis]|uniref:Uncharacterized protein n=1 Tax=Paenibacillus medicaginis TaxID=1470560 RepID=A0ABV5BV04_9BACL